MLSILWDKYIQAFSTKSRNFTRKKDSKAN